MDTIVTCIHQYNVSRDVYRFDADAMILVIQFTHVMVAFDCKCRQMQVDCVLTGIISGIVREMLYQPIRLIGFSLEKNRI